MKIGVFDSGVGGLSVAHALREAFPEHEIIFANDPGHVPYGSRTSEEVLEFVKPIFQDLVNQGCGLIVVACNTVSTTLIVELRTQFPSVELVAIEPMVKPAVALTKSGIIAVCATPATLASSRYKWLKTTYAMNVLVLEPDCSQWAYMVEHDQVSDGRIARQIDEVCSVGADVIVLGCTHYHWIEEKITDTAAGRAQVIQPERSIAARVRYLLTALS